MKSLIATALLLSSDALPNEETSLMQGLVARRGHLTPEASAKQARQDNTAKLMETATKMMKSGATPDVITFIETTITEVNRDVLGVIVKEHNENQKLVNDLAQEFKDAITAMETCRDQVAGMHDDREAAGSAHQVCRSQEALDCARSRKCEDELESLWTKVKIAEDEMRRIHREIHGEWCCDPLTHDPLHADYDADNLCVVPPQVVLDDPFRWVPERAAEGPETSGDASGTEDKYPIIDNDHVKGFRSSSVTKFKLYIEQKPRVEAAWRLYNEKLLECARADEYWTLKVEECDGLQTTLHAQACRHNADSRACVGTYGREYHRVQVEWDAAVVDVTQQEYDRKREWETLHIVTCLLETVYTHVIHSIDSGDPCPTTESHPEQTAAEINTCHIVEESMTNNLTIIWPDIPPPPPLPPVVEPPCTQQYLWDESGSMSFETDLQTWKNTIDSEGLGSYFTALSAAGWAGCAAPKACTPCDAGDPVPDTEYIGQCPSRDGSDNALDCTCKRHQEHLIPGQMNRDTFMCVTGDECISSTGRCNGHPQCGDGSDEADCNTDWGVPAVKGTQKCIPPPSSCTFGEDGEVISCSELFVPDVQFRCAGAGGTTYVAEGRTPDEECIDIAALCNGVQNCPDNSDEVGCHEHGHELTSFVSLEAMTGLPATIVPAVSGEDVFYNERTETPEGPGRLARFTRSYTFDDLGSLAGTSFIRMSNEDKHIPGTHVQMKLRLTHPMTVYVAVLGSDRLSWLQEQGWVHKTEMTGVKYSGVGATNFHTDWHKFETISETYGPGEVWAKTFPAGTVEMQGNGGGDGSYLMFVANPEHAPVTGN